MAKFIIKRITASIPTIAGVISLVFVMIHLTPGDPVEIMLGENPSPADRIALRESLGLDRPILIQYFDYMKKVATLDLGVSIQKGEPVFDLIAELYPSTVILAISSMLVAILIAIPFGTIAAYYRGKAIDMFLMWASLAGVSIPSFWLGPMLIIFFSIYLKLLPVSGFDSYLSLILPSITLGTAMAAILSRLLRSSLISAMNEDYILTARAKGLSETSVVMKHAMRNSLAPVTTVAGLQLGALLSGAIITETIFAWPGIGSLTVDAIMARDYPLVQGAVLTLALNYTFVNMAVDIIYKMLDPRVKL